MLKLKNELTSEKEMCFNYFNRRRLGTLISTFANLHKQDEINSRKKKLKNG